MWQNISTWVVMMWRTGPTRCMQLVAEGLSTAIKLKHILNDNAGPLGWFPCNCGTVRSTIVNTCSYTLMLMNSPKISGKELTTNKPYILISTCRQPNNFLKLVSDCAGMYIWGFNVYGEISPHQKIRRPWRPRCSKLRLAKRTARPYHCCYLES